MSDNIIGYVEKTQHQYKRLHMDDIESIDNCGTCDGACCDICKTIYVVEDWSNDKTIYRGGDKEEAVKLAGYNFV